MVSPHDPLWRRREVLRGGALLGASALLAGAFPGALVGAPFGAPGALVPQPLWPAHAFLPGARKTKRVVLVVFGGGVRSRETIESDNVPNLMRIAQEGVLYPATRVVNNGHYAASMSILTGVSESFGIRENQRSPNPTLFEILRREANLPASEVWLSTAGGEQETNYAYSLHSSYGRRYGANLIGGEGIFNAEFKELLSGGGSLRAPDPAQEELLARLRAAVEPSRAAAGSAAGLGNDVESAARIERYLIEELRGGTSAITGLGANDAKALRVARNLVGIFRPRLLGVTLRNADVAHGSINDYVAVIRRNDAEVGELFDAIRQDPELAESTALFILPEFGRDRDLNERRGLDHGDDSLELHRVALIAWGPDFRRGKVEQSEVRSIDVCPTIAAMFGVTAGTARGGSLPGLFA
ncbi:MAG: hypothetical protein ACT4PU_07700 [Planctomycetota bacterium]